MAGGYGEEAFLVGGVVFSSSSGAIPGIPPKLRAVGPEQPGSAGFHPSPQFISPFLDPASRLEASGDGVKGAVSAGASCGPSGAGLGTVLTAGSLRTQLLAPLTRLPPPPARLCMLHFPVKQTRANPGAR